MHKILLTAGLCLILATLASSKRLVCYYDSKAATRPSVGQFTPANIDPNLCTHIIFGFASINNQNELVPTDITADPPLYTQLNKLKIRNPQLITLLAVGGPKFNIQKFSTMVAEGRNRSTFIASVIALLKQYNFDGLNLDWRYPGGAGSKPQDKRRFTKLCQELRTAFNKEAPVPILSASVSAEKTVIDNSYEMSSIAKFLDFINVLSFDFHGPWESTTAHHSPLNALSTNPADTLTTSYAMNYWRTYGAPAAKLNMGIAAYGRAFTLTDPSNNGVGAPASGAAEEGCYGGETGLWSYYETCLYIEGGVRHWISDQSVPYAVTDGQWVGYDDIESLNAKIAHITSNAYGGACVWSMDLDDYTGQFCNQGRNPFIRNLLNLLVLGTQTPSTVTITTKTSTAVPPIVTTTAKSEYCQTQSGVFPNPNDKTSYYNCDFGRATLQYCPSGLVFKTFCTCCTYP